MIDARSDLPVLMTESRYGPMFGLATDPYVARALALLGEFSPEEVSLLLNLLGDGSVVIEAGAHCGAITVPLAQRVGPRGKVFAFEPQRALFRLLRANLAINNVAGIAEPRMEPVDEIHRQLDVPVFDYFREENFGGFPATLVEFTALDRRRVAHETLKTRRIDDLGLDRCAMIKADVEGMEIGVIGGALETIERCRPRLYLECHQSNARRLLPSLGMMDYQLWWHTPSYFVADNFKGASADPWPDQISTNVLAVPSEAPLGEQLIVRHMLRRIDDPLRSRPTAD